MTSALSYVADRPMNVLRITNGTYVYVPVWREGDVVGWENGSVIQVAGPEYDRSYVVEYPGTDIPPVTMLPHSVMCGVCMGRTDVTCHQCSQPVELAKGFHAILKLHRAILHGEDRSLTVDVEFPSLSSAVSFVDGYPECPMRPRDPIMTFLGSVVIQFPYLEWLRAADHPVPGWAGGQIDR